MPSGNFPGYMKTLQAIWKLSRLYENFQGYMKTFQAIWKPSKPSGNFPCHLETSPQQEPHFSRNLENFLQISLLVLDFGPFQFHFQFLKKSERIIFHFSLLEKGKIFVFFTAICREKRVKTKSVCHSTSAISSCIFDKSVMREKVTFSFLQIIF